MLRRLWQQSHKFDYALVGHSGDSDCLPLVDYGHPPPNRAERLKVLNKMVAHAQYCFSGDSTLEATARAVSEVAALEADDRLVFVLSDANLRRYGIPPAALAKHMTVDPRVQVFAIFLASMADEAQRTVAALPPGRGFACLDTSELPALLRTIFAARVAAV